MLQRLLFLLQAVRGIKYSVKSKAKFLAQLICHGSVALNIKLKNRYAFECVGSDGRVKWIDYIDNLVVNVGLNDLLTKYFKGSSYTAAWYAFLVDNAGWTAFAAGDTSASHAGWVESTAYSGGTRPAVTLGTATGGSIDNSASKAVFNINATATLKGAGIASSSAQNSTTDIIYGEGAWASGLIRAVQSGDTLNVTVTLTAATA